MARRILWSALSLALALTLPLSAQIDLDEENDILAILPLDELLDNYYQAMGGEKAWLETNSLKMTGVMRMGPGMDAPFTAYSLRPDKRRLEFTFQGLTGVQAINGNEAWTLMPFMGQTTPQPMPEEMATQMRELLDIEGPLIDFVAKGHTLEYLGIGQAQGIDAYKIKVLLESGSVHTYYLDGEDFVPFLLESTRTDDGVVVESETLLKDYELVEGLLLPHTIEIRAKGQPGGQVVKIEEVEVDLELADVQFEMPTIGTQDGSQDAAEETE